MPYAKNRLQHLQHLRQAISRLQLTRLAQAATRKSRLALDSRMRINRVAQYWALCSIEIPMQHLRTRGYWHWLITVHMN